MSHRCVRALPEKEKISKQLKTSEKNCCLESRFTADSKYVKHCNTTDGQQKMKRLKTRRERSLMRGGWKQTSSTKSHHYHCRCRSGKDLAHFHNCCHSSCHCPSVKEKQFPSVAPAASEPSIITDGRLIGHHGLFNHEVKSIDIERLLSEQRNLKKSGQHVKEQYKATLHPSSSSCIPAPFSSDGLLDADTDVAVPSQNRADPATKTHYDCQEKEKQTLQFHRQGLDVTPGQRPQQQLDLSSGSFKSILSSKHSSLSVVTTKTSKTNYVMSEKDIGSQLTPIFDRDNLKTLKKKVKRKMISTLELMPKTLESPVHQKQISGLSPSLLQLQSSPTVDSFDVHYRRQNPKYVSKSVSALAVRLCDSLEVLLLGRRNLLSESREVLLKSLREKHGPWLQENLLEMQKCFSFGMDPTKTVQDQDQEIMVDEHEVLPTDTSITMTGSKNFNWKFSPQPHQDVKQFFMDFEPSGPSASEGFTPSLTMCKEEIPSERWENSFNRSNSKVMFDFFENTFVNHSSADRERSCGPQYGDNNIQPFFSHQTQLPDRHPSEPAIFPQEQDPLETNRYPFSPLFPAKIPHFHQSNYLLPFSQFRQPLACPPPTLHHTDMMHYPSSQMLERSMAPPLSSLPSPEHWSFPAMRLY